MKMKQLVVGIFFGMGLSAGCGEAYTPSEVAPGDECTLGGVRFKHSRDAKRDKLICHHLAPPVTPKTEPPVRTERGWEYAGNLTLDTDHDMPPVAKVGGTLLVEVSSVTHLPDLPLLTEVGGLQVHGDAASSMQTLVGFSGLKTVHGDLEIDVPSAERIAGFEALEKVGGRIVINESLVMPVAASGALSWLKKKTGPAGQEPPPKAPAEPMGAARLQVLEAFPNLTAAGGVVIRRQGALRAITGFGKLQTLGAGAVGASGVGLTLVQNPRLTHLEGFGSLQQVDRLQLVGNTALADVGSLSSLRQVGDMEVGHNDALDVFELPSVERLGPANFYDNGHLSKLGFPALQAGPKNVWKLQNNPLFAAFVPCADAQVQIELSVMGKCLWKADNIDARPSLKTNVLQTEN